MTARKTAWVLLGVLCLLAATAVCVVVMISLDREPSEVVYVVPDGYRGAIEITYGADESSRPNDGPLMITIPRSGKLQVPWPPPEKWVTVDAKYFSGKDLPIDWGEDLPGVLQGPAPTVVSLHHADSEFPFENGPVSYSVKQWLFVGTKEEFEQFSASPHSHRTAGPQDP